MVLTAKVEKKSKKRPQLRRAPEDSGSAAKDSHGSAASIPSPSPQISDPSKVDPINVEGPLSKDAGDSDSDVIVEFHENVISSKASSPKMVAEVGPTNSGVAGDMKPLSSEIFRMISLSTLEGPIFPCFAEANGIES